MKSLQELRDIYLLLRAVRLRTRVQRGLRAVALTAMCALWCLVAAVVLSKLVAFTTPVWLGLLLAAVGALPLAFAYGCMRRFSLVQAAVLTDEQLGLRERISSALLLGELDHPFVRAQHEDALRHARAARPAQVAPLILPGGLGRSWIPMLLAAGLWFVPPWDPSADAAAQRPATAHVPVPMPEQARQLVQLAEKVREATTEVTAAEMDKIADDIERLAQELKEGRKSPRQALAEMSRSDEALERNRERMARMVSAARNVSPELSDPTMAEVAEDMRRGEFANAEKRLEQIREELEKGEMSAEQMERLSQAMAEMGRQLAQQDPATAQALSQAAQALSQAAQQMGQDPQQARQSLAEASQALREMAEQMQQLQELAEQMDRMDQLCQASSQCKSGMCQGGGEGQGKKPGGSGEGGGGGSGSGDEARWNQLFAAGPGQGQGAWAEGDTNRQGSGFGGPGKGEGGQVPIGDGATTFQPDTIGGPNLQQGEIVAMMRVKGEQMTGESLIEFSEAVMESRQQAAETLSRETVPLGYRNYVQRYFDAIDPSNPAVSSAGPAPVEVENDGS